MKQIIFLTLLTLSAAEVTDLGTLSSSRAIHLTTDNPDFRCFRVELIALPSSNKLILHLTNDLITISNLQSLPSGKIAGGVQTICMDGEPSEIERIKFRMRRDRPQKPTVSMIEFGRPTNLHESFTWLQGETNIVSPPTPGIIIDNAASNIYKTTIIDYSAYVGTFTNPPLMRQSLPIPDTNTGLPLPGGRPETYGQYLDRISNEKRRNQ